MNNFTYEYKLLVISPDQKVTGLAHSVFTMKPYVFQSVTSSADAEKVVNDWNPSLILFDLTENGDQGLSLLERIRQNRKHKYTQIITCVNIESRDVLKRAFELGISGSLLKPLLKEEMLHMIDLQKQQYEKDMQIRLLKEKTEKQDLYYGSISKALRSSIHSMKLMTTSLLHTLGKDRIETDEYEMLLNIYKETTDVALIWDNFIKTKHLNPAAQPPHKQRIDVNSILSNIANSYLPLAKQKNVTLLKEGFDMELLAEVDVEIFRSIVRNFLSNAIHDNEEGGQVILSSYVSPKEEYIIKVSYNGTSGQVKDEMKVSGLQLCNSYAKAHNGKIWADTANNSGTAYYFSFPN